MPIVLDTKPLLRPQFTSTEFKATKWDSAEVKAEFANKLCKFIAADFKESLFTKALYSRLSNTFGHIAHYAETVVMRTCHKTTATEASRPLDGLRKDTSAPGAGSA
jgi:hypothetical protein